MYIICILKILIAVPVIFLILVRFFVPDKCPCLDKTLLLFFFRLNFVGCYVTGHC